MALRIFESYETGFRQEYKFYISQKEALELKKRLRKVMKKDVNSDENWSYIVSSVYFDDFSDHSLLSSDAGLPFRKKYRIRAYNHDDSFISLERKEKSRNLSKKTQQRITREDYDSIMSGNPEPLKKYSSEVAKSFYFDVRFSGYRPKTVVEYRREVYSYPVLDVRITLDFDIKGSVSGTDIFGSPTLISTLNPCGVLLEVKYNHVLPDFIGKLLPKNIMPRTANCKYALGRKYI